jgi:hypothetical protein
MEQKDLDNRFIYHEPKDGQSLKYERIRHYGKDLAMLMNKLCPESREKSLAVTKLEEAIMWANASIARNE